MTFSRLRVFAMLGVLGVAACARADAIRDAAGLFSDAARRQAQEKIDNIRDIYHLDIIVETIAAPPENDRKQVASLKKPELAAYFKRLAAEKAEAAGVDGVYVLLCADPGYVEVTVQPKSREQEFTSFDAWRLQFHLKSMRNGPARVKDRDAKLLAATAQIRDALYYNHLPPFPWLAVGGAIAGVLGLWSVLGLVRMRLRAADPAEGPSEPRRLDLFHALLGNMFGNVAGYWIYDTLFVAASRSAAPATELVEAPPAPEPVEDAEPQPPTKAQRMDLAARNHTTEDEPSASESARF